MTVLEMIPTPDPRTLDEATRPFAEAIASHYAIKKLIGQGGMGLVYLARDKRLDRLVAIKTLLPQLAADASVRERFLRETRTAGAMSHPNIVPIHGADEVNGHVFFVMGYVDGESLASHVRAHGQLSPREVALWLRDVAAALAHAHARGIVHRDIKAENILIERSTTRALVTDFGIARLADAQPLTATGQLLGTVYYVSPEQVAGEPIDARSDLYSLGVVGFFALTGRFPFDSDVASAVLVAHVTKPAPPLAFVRRDVPAGLAAIIDRCLAKKPNDRFASAEELLAALDGAIAQMDGGSAALAKPALVTETEAHSIWQRAAELQASTGIHPRPEPVARPRTASKQPTRTSGFKVDEIREAASAAGIDTRYVEHALVEHGLTNVRPPVAVPQPKGSVTSARTVLARETIVAGELPPREFERVLNTMREATGRMGVTNAKTREISWRGGPLQVAIVPDDGATTIRLVRSTKSTARWAFGRAAFAGMMVIGPATGAIVNAILTLPSFGLGVLSPHAIDQISALIGVGLAIASIPVARAYARRTVAQRDTELAELSDALVAKVRDGIDAE